MGIPQEDAYKYLAPPDKIQKVFEYFKTKTEQDWVDGLKKYHVNYLIFDQLNPDWITKGLSQYQFLKPVYNINGITIYEVK